MISRHNNIKTFEKINHQLEYEPSIELVSPFVPSQAKCS